MRIIFLLLITLLTNSLNQYDSTNIVNEQESTINALFMLSYRQRANWTIHTVTYDFNFNEVYFVEFKMFNTQIIQGQPQFLEYVEDFRTISLNHTQVVRWPDIDNPHHYESITFLSTEFKELGKMQLFNWFNIVELGYDSTIPIPPTEEEKPPIEEEKPPIEEEKPPIESGTNLNVNEIVAFLLIFAIILVIAFKIQVYLIIPVLIIGILFLFILLL